MATGTLTARLVADVKCYYCGHISGQIVGARGQPMRVTNFVPRPGYTGPEVKAGLRLRCERCSGPVFLEDTTNLTEDSARRSASAVRRTADRRKQQAA